MGLKNASSVESGQNGHVYALAEPRKGTELTIYHFVEGKWEFAEEHTAISISIDKNGDLYAVKESEKGDGMRKVHRTHADLSKCLRRNIYMEQKEENLSDDNESQMRNYIIIASTIAVSFIILITVFICVKRNNNNSNKLESEMPPISGVTANADIEASI